ncbi:MAG: hypothetical protein JSR77_10975 [Planctomycetes bacterium]|nr:hypothetical protein [Planctomycetota bacterium]
MKWLLLFVALFLPGCAGTWCSGEPLYPKDWPPIVAAATDHAPADLSGTYRAVSDPVGPMEYGPGDAPREMIFFISYGDPKTPPVVGRRILPWHLIGFQDEKHADVLKQLEAFSVALKPDAQHPDGQDDLGWVRLKCSRPGESNGIIMECGVDREPMVTTTLVPTPKQTPVDWLTTMPGGYRILEDGAYEINSSFPASALEHFPDSTRNAAGTFRFYRTADGSLVMLESLHFAPAGGEVTFQKWWHWRRIE